MRRLALIIALCFYWTILPAFAAPPIIKDLVVKEYPWADARAYLTWTDAIIGSKTVIVSTALSATDNINLPANTRILFIDNGSITLAAGKSIILNNGVVLDGSSKDQNRIIGNSTVALLKAPASVIEKVIIRDMGITNTSEANVGGVGIDFARVNHSSVSNVKITDVETGVKIYTPGNQGWYNGFSNVDIDRIAYGYKFYENGNENWVYNGSIKNATIAGADIDNNSGITLFNVAIEDFGTGGTGYGVRVSPTAAATGVRLIANRFECNATTAANSILIGAATQQFYAVGNYDEGTTGGILNSATNKRHVAIIDYNNGSFFPLFTLQMASPSLRFIDTGGTANKSYIDIAYNTDRLTFTARYDNAAFIRDIGSIIHDGGIQIGGSTGPVIYSGAGSPQSVVTAVVGSFYLNTTGSDNTTGYLKTSGSGNTGWKAILNQ